MGKLKFIGSSEGKVVLTVGDVKEDQLFIMSGRLMGCSMRGVYFQLTHEGGVFDFDTYRCERGAISYDDEIEMILTDITGIDISEVLK